MSSITHTDLTKNRHSSHRVSSLSYSHSSIDILIAHYMRDRTLAHGTMAWGCCPISPEFSHQPCLGELWWNCIAKDLELNWFLVRPTIPPLLSTFTSPSSNVRGELVFSVMAADWFCETSGWIGKVEDVKPVFLKTKWISTRNHFEEEDFYPDEL